MTYEEAFRRLFEIADGYGYKPVGYRYKDGPDEGADFDSIEDAIEELLDAGSTELTLFLEHEGDHKDFLLGIDTSEEPTRVVSSRGLPWGGNRIARDWRNEMEET